MTYRYLVRGSQDAGAYFGVFLPQVHLAMCLISMRSLKLPTGLGFVPCRIDIVPRTLEAVADRCITSYASVG